MPLPLVDTSRYTTGVGRCWRLRFLEYQLDGFGIRRDWNQVPTVGGIMVHRIYHQLLRLRLDRPAATINEYRRVIHIESDRYYDSAKEQAISDVPPEEDGAERLHTCAEQQALIECLGWAFLRSCMEWIVAEYDIIALETEYVTVVGCNCGLGDHPIQILEDSEPHVERGCGGVLLMGKPDVLGVHRQSGETHAIDYKVTGWGDSKTWRDKFERNVQFALHTHAIAAHIGRPVDAVLVMGVNKGRRERRWDPVNKAATGPKRQSSWLCYAYYRPGQPPFTEEDWKLSYYYFDEDGKRRAVKGKGYQHIPTWEAFSETEDGIRPAEQWMASRTDEEVSALFLPLPPIPTPARFVYRLLRGLVATEDRIVSRGLTELGQVTERLNSEGVTEPWAHEDYQTALDATFPQSFECKRWNHQCEMVPICFEEPGWVTPYDIGFKMRRPHHQPELDYMRSLGFEPPPEIGRDDD